MQSGVSFTFFELRVGLVRIWYDSVNAQREIRGLMRLVALKLRDGLAV